MQPIKGTVEIGMATAPPTQSRQQSAPSKVVPTGRTRVFQENGRYPSQFLLHEVRML